MIAVKFQLSMTIGSKMYPKKKGSGFSFRKKKAEKEKALAKLRNSFQRYLQDSRSETGAVPSGQ